MNTPPDRTRRRTGRVMATPGAISFNPTEIERRLGELIRADGDRRRWLHGGAPGLRPGDRLLPGSVTGNRNGCGRHPADLPDDRQFVYITRDRGIAQWHADRYPGGGAVYSVEPEGGVWPDPYIVRGIATSQHWQQLYRVHLKTGEALGMACCCRAAAVIGSAPPSVLADVHEITANPRMR